MVRFFVFFGLVASSVAYEKFPLVDKFEKWVNDFEIKIENEVSEQHILYNWIENNKFINQINNQELSYKLKHNKFSGMNQTEFTNYLGFEIENTQKYLRTQNLNDNGDINNINLNYSENFDWREEGFNLEVSDQGSCGSCWSFSTTEALSGIYFIENGDLINFSKQQLVDCDNMQNVPRGISNGCNGGQIAKTFDWIGKNNGLCSNEDYPYVSGTTKTEQECEKDCEVIKKSKVSGYVNVKQSDDEAMMTAIHKQPVSVAIQADQKAFQLYSSGVFTGECTTDLDHAVLLIGYGTDNNVDYFTIKNSWSSDWGENGYIRIGRGTQFNNGDGQCGVLLQGSYPNL
jgi:C1A family cysteine protease